MIDITASEETMATHGNLEKTMADEDLQLFDWVV